MCALFKKNEKTVGKKQPVVTPFQGFRDRSRSNITLRQTTSIINFNEEEEKTKNNTSLTNQTHQYRENIVFVYLDDDTPLNHEFIGQLRVINDDLHEYSSIEECLHLLRYSNDRIFFISTSDDKDLIREAHDYPTVQAIFLWNFDAQIDQVKFPKFVGVYNHSEELIVSIRNALEWFEQTQLEFIVFEGDQLFIWSQLWREFIKPTNPAEPSKKEKLVDMAEQYYRGNNKLLELLNDFNNRYERNNALQWCFISPFPSRFLHQALSSRNTKHIDLCRFLINDVSRLLRQPNEQQTNREFYRGMKVTEEGLEKLIKHSGKLICPKGFFTCYKSRKAALDLARTPDYREDFRPVLVKISCPPSVSISEVPSTKAVGLVVFDLYIAFRVKYVNTGPVTVVKLEPAVEDGRSLARVYRIKHKSENFYNLLDELATLPRPPLPPLPPPPPPSPPPPPRVKSVEIRPPVVLDDEMLAQELVHDGKIDQALALYENMRSQSPRILKTIGNLHADKKGDYTAAVKYYKQAMEIQEKNNEDIGETLTQLGIAHHNSSEFGLAIEYHNRALELQKNKQTHDAPRMANSLLGIANAQWGQDNILEAYEAAQQALALNESVETGNDLNLAKNLAVLANIFHRDGDDTEALDYSKRALAILERCVPLDLLGLASILNNMGTIQMALDLFAESQQSFERALKICEENLPEGHPKRETMRKNVRRNEEIIAERRKKEKLQE